MNTMDNAQVMEALEKYTIYNYFEKLVDAKMHKVVLFPVFPFTAAANFSDPRHIMLIDDLSRLTSLNTGRIEN
jgi:hypothetical protein